MTDTATPSTPPAPGRSGRARAAVAIAVAVAAVVVGAAVWSASRDRAAAPLDTTGLPLVARGTRAPPFSLSRLGGGQPVSSGMGQGHPMVINFFASWCPNCAGELQAFARVDHAAQGRIVFLGVDTNDPGPGAAARMLAGAGVRYPVGIDGSARIARSYLVVGLPTTVFVNRLGQVVGEGFGSQSDADLRTWVRRLEAP